MDNYKETKHLLDNKMQEIQVSSNANAAIEKGMKRAQRSKRYKRKMAYGLSTVAVLFLCFPLLLRISPAFAQMIEMIPGLGAIVSLVQYDKGIEDSIDNHYYQEIGASQTNQDITLTVDGIIADETGMVISYTIEAPFPINNLKLKNTHLEQGGKDMTVGYSLSHFFSENPITKYQNTIKVIAGSSKIDYSNRDLKLFATIEGKEDVKFSIPFSLNNEIAKTVVYEVNETVTIANQQMKIHSMEISPLRAAIDMTFRDENTMEIFDFEKLELVDEKGEIWGTGEGILGYGGVGDKERTYFFESNYFRQPKELYLVIGDVQAMPKKDREVVIDFDKRKVLSQSKKYPLHIENIKNRSFKVKLKSERASSYTFFSSGVDANGKDISIGFSSDNLFDDGGHYFFDSTFRISEETFQNPVTFKLQAYPNYLEGSAKIKLYK